MALASDKARSASALLARQAPPRRFSSKAPLNAVPKLVVFDLDATLWTPELFTLRRIAGYAAASLPGPRAGSDVKLIDGVADVFLELSTDPKWQGTRIGVASRTNKAPWAFNLLQQFTVVADGKERTLDSMIPFKQIFPGDKDKHFQRLQKDSGVSFEDMLFFDDARGGKFGNCELVARCGVMAAHCPQGLTKDVWDNALNAYAKRKAAGSPMGIVVDAPPKRLRAAPARPPATPKAPSDVGLSSSETVRVSCFSMGMPFAALLGHGAKTLETRNNDMFSGRNGETVALHVGQRDFADGGAHAAILKRRAGIGDVEVKRLTALPKGFKRGDVVALVKLGGTTLVPDAAARKTPTLEAGAVATGDAMGRYITVIDSVQWLAEAVPVKGRPNLFDVELPRTALSDFLTRR
ncbi:acid phosphatase-domain-containing protein [Pelagophyceae sp. CCMP2097]|nr:acid phosphatase-domain-containing protein [Pelagophyceae sp. CCMP2097]